MSPSASPTPLAKLQAVRIQELVGEQHLRVGREVDEVPFLALDEPLFHQLLGGTAHEGLLSKHRRSADLLPLDATGVPIELAVVVAELVHVCTRAGRPCGRLERLPRLVPHQCRGLALLGSHATLSVRLHVDRGQLDRLDPRFDRHEDRVPRHHLEDLGVAGRVADTVGAQLVEAGVRRPNDEGAPRIGEHLAERLVRFVEKPDHRPVDRGPLDGFHQTVR